MKIALIAPIEETVPPFLYGGTEWIVYHLAHLLHTHNISVDLYAAGNSPTEPVFTLIPTVPQNLRENTDTREDLKLRESYKWLSLTETVQLIDKQSYDVIHNHAGWRFLIDAPFLKSKTPILTTHHMALNLPYQNAVFKQYAQFPHVSISNNQRKDLPELNYVATVYNGLALQDYPYIGETKEIKEQSLLFLARMSHEKGGIDAAKAALSQQMKLIVAAKVDEVDKEYFDSFKTLLDGRYIDFIGEVGPPAKQAMLRKAKALIAPIQWEEPFGLMFIEAMASGTPVIAYARGAAPEIIEDGKTGFLVNQDAEHIAGHWSIKQTGVEGLSKAIEQLNNLSNDAYLRMCQNARKRVEEHFTADIMVAQYAKLYESLTLNR